MIVLPRSFSGNIFGFIFSGENHGVCFCRIDRQAFRFASVLYNLESFVHELPKSIEKGASHHNSHVLCVAISEKACLLKFHHKFVHHYVLQQGR